MRVDRALVTFALAALLAAGGAAAQQPGQPAPGMGPGTMGPGMMGGGMGPGMMGGGGMGPGMMGRGMGGGMKMGPGGGLGMLGQLGLSESQRSEVFKIHDELRRKNWELAGKMMDEEAKLRDAFFASGKRDRTVILAAYKRIGELRLQRIENGLDAAEKLEAILTPQQREQLTRWGPWWMRDLER
jgi:Spy/CpxP family protein refolding chaperone